MQRLVHIPDEVYDDLESFCLRRSAGLPAQAPPPRSGTIFTPRGLRLPNMNVTNIQKGHMKRARNKAGLVRSLEGRNQGAPQL
jgi:hypothetical protein